MDQRPVVIVGGGLAGMAAAARLAKAGHSVELFEAAEQLGGRWAASDFQGLKVDHAPGILSFPAPWRDLFRKSGRAFEAELTRAGVELVPAQAARHIFGDGTELVLPADRGEQVETLTRAYGRTMARRWRDLVDDLDAVWQTVRPLGLESELRGRYQLTKGAKTTLMHRRTIDQLATTMDEPHLADIIRSVAYRLGSVPSKTPAWCAVQLSVERRFGRWTVQAPDRQGRSSVLVELLAERLRTRRVTVQLGQPVAQITVDRSGAATEVVTADGRHHTAAAVICTTDPWHAYNDLIPRRSAGSERRAVRRLTPALAPSVDFSVLAERTAHASETISHGRGHGPVVSFASPADAATVTAVHDFSRATPQPGAGVAWDGFASWLRRPPISSAVGGLFLAGPHARGGEAPSATLLSGALSSYACHDYRS